MRRCPECQTENEAFFRFCIACGADLDALVEQAPSPQAAPEPRISRDKTSTPQVGERVGDAASQALAQAQAAARVQIPKTHSLKDGAPPAAPRPPVPRPPGVMAPVVPPAKVQVSDRLRPLAPPTLRASQEQERQTTELEAAPGAKAQLVLITDAGDDGRRIPLHEGVTSLGRQGTHIAFEGDEFLAKHHLDLHFHDGDLILNPHRSTNGVYVQIKDQIELQHADFFRIGQQLLVFELIDALRDHGSQGSTQIIGSPMPQGIWGRLSQVITPQARGTVYLLGGERIELGREIGDITFPKDGFVSGIHAQICVQDDRFFLADLDSSNGTYIRLNQQHRLRNGTLVLAGQQLFRIEM